MDEDLKKELDNWLIKADNDLHTAEFGLTAEKPITDTICFHCQQAVEKYLKLFIMYSGVIPERTHNIAMLLKKCQSIEPSFKKLSGIEYLTDYAVTLRYADNFYVPSTEEAKEAFIEAKKVRVFLLGKISG